MSDARKRFAARVRRRADDLVEELAAMPNEVEPAMNSYYRHKHTHGQHAAYLKACHVINQMHTIGEWIAELVESGDLDVPPAETVLKSVDEFRRDSEARGNVPRSRGLITFWYFLRDWLPRHDAAFDRDTDGNVGSESPVFPTVMIRNMRTLADAIEAVSLEGNDVVQAVLAGLPSDVTDMTRKAARLLAQGVSHNGVNERLGIGVGNSRQIKSRYVTPHLKNERDTSA